MPLTLEIVTPEARVYSDTVDTVVIPTVEGEIGILPGHIPLLTQVGARRAAGDQGRRDRVARRRRRFRRRSRATSVSVLAESAINEEKIDENAVEDAMKRAEEALNGKDRCARRGRTPGSLVRFSVAQLGVKRRRR